MELRGIVIFKLSNVGSHSEGVFPYLYIGKGEFVKIYMIDDNPFENNFLQEYDSKKVILEGEFNEYNTFVIEKIDEDLPASDDSNETEEIESL